MFTTYDKILGRIAGVDARGIDYIVVVRYTYYDGEDKLLQQTIPRGSLLVNPVSVYVNRDNPDDAYFVL